MNTTEEFLAAKERKERKDPADASAPILTRRHFLNRSSLGLGAIGLASLLNERLFAADTGGLPGLPHFAAKAKRVIYLFQ